jgi:hypothetical protein
MPFTTEDPQYRARIGAFTQRLQERGYLNGRNLQLEFPASAGNAAPQSPGSWIRKVPPAQGRELCAARGLRPLRDQQVAAMPRLHRGRLNLTTPWDALTRR